MMQRSHHQSSDLADGSHRKKDDCHNTPLKMRIQIWCKIQDNEIQDICQILPFHCKLDTAAPPCVATWLHYMTCTEVRNPRHAVVRLKQGQWHIKLPGGRRVQVSSISVLDKTHPKRSCHSRWRTGERAMRTQQYCLGPAISHDMQPCHGHERIRNMNKEGIPTIQNLWGHCGVCIANLWKRRSKEPTAYLINYQ